MPADCQHQTRLEEVELSQKLVWDKKNKTVAEHVAFKGNRYTFEGDNSIKNILLPSENGLL